MEDFLDGTDKDSLNDDELVSLYESIETHYEAALDYEDDDKFEYEIEIAYDALESYNVVNGALNKDNYLEYGSGGTDV